MKPKRILIVDDERDLLKSIDLTLRINGYTVVAVDNGADAFAKIVTAHEMKEQFDLVITDHHLPVISGIELIDHVKAEGVTVPFGMITAYGSKELQQELKDRGSLFCLDKPFNIRELVAAVSLALTTNDYSAGTPGADNEVGSSHTAKPSASKNSIHT
jgi:two-component system response regulator AtoC